MTFRGLQSKFRYLVIVEYALHHLFIIDRHGVARFFCFPISWVILKQWGVGVSRVRGIRGLCRSIFVTYALRHSHPISFHRCGLEKLDNSLRQGYQSFLTGVDEKMGSSDPVTPCEVMESASCSLFDSVPSYNFIKIGTP